MITSRVVQPVPLARRIKWGTAVALASHHIVALLGILWFFSWAGVAVAILGVYVFGILGVGVGFHRLLAHRSFTCPRWLERIFVILGVCGLQGTPAQWVAVHRRHHAHSDDQLDPHSPRVGVFWSHTGWLLFKDGDLSRRSLHERYAKDILRDSLCARLERGPWLGIVLIASWLTFLLGGFAADLLMGESIAQAWRYGASILIFGVFVRIVLVWHITWSLNSVTHLWGYRSYLTDDSSRNNFVIGILSGGEGWHNNHHADPRSAKHGHAWWEVDVAYLTIRFLASFGLVRGVIMPRQDRLSRITLS
jgi:fatty-acid desaturase